MTRTTAMCSAFLVDFRIALRNVRRQRRRSALAMLAIIFGVIAMMLSGGFIEWIFWASREGTAVTQIGHIQVVKPGYYESGQADPFSFLLPEHAPALNSLEATPGVRSVTPRLDFTGLISHGDNTMTYLAKGVDPVSDPSLRYLIIAEGQRLDPEVPKGILIGTGLAANLGVGVGDEIVLLAGTKTGGINAVEAHIQGLASTSMKAYDDTTLWLPIAMARELLRTSGAHVWVISLEDSEQTSTVFNRLRNDAAFRHFEIAPWTKLADFYNKTVELLTRQINVVKAIISIIILLSISNSMSMSVIERTVEIGTAMALGVRRGRILRLFLIEGTLLGVIGGLCGLVIGYLLALLISYIGIPMPPSPGMSRGFTAGIIITPKIVEHALLLSVTTTLLASLYPAWRASKLMIVDALRHNR